MGHLYLGHLAHVYLGNLYPVHLSVLFTKRNDVLLQDQMTFRNREIRIWTFPIAQKINKHIGTSAAALPRCLSNFRAMRSL